MALSQFQARAQRGKTGFLSPDPDAAAAEEASEDGQVLHEEDDADLEAVELAEAAIADLSLKVRTSLHRTRRVIRHLEDAIREDERLLAELEDRERRARELTDRVRARIPSHVTGHRTISGALEQRQRGKLRIHVSPERDVEING